MRPSQEQLDANKRVVLDFYEKALNQSDLVAASEHFGPRYTQHTPHIEDGIAGFIAFVGRLKEQFPEVRGEIKRVIAEGDLVVLHVHAKRTPDELGIAIVDIFRLDHGKIVEHWDVRQPIPELFVHQNSMF